MGQANLLFKDLVLKATLVGVESFGRGQVAAVSRVVPALQ